MSHSGSAVLLLLVATRLAISETSREAVRLKASDSTMEKRKEGGLECGAVSCGGHLMFSREKVLRRESVWGRGEVQELRSEIKTLG